MVPPARFELAAPSLPIVRLTSTNYSNRAKKSVVFLLYFYM